MVDAHCTINWTVVSQLLLAPTVDRSFITVIVKLCLQHDFVAWVYQRQLILEEHAVR